MSDKDDFRYDPKDDPEYDPKWPRIWYRHTGTGNVTVKQACGFFIMPGTRMADDYDSECLYSITYETFIEYEAKDKVITARLFVPSLEDVDFVTTGKMPTEESLAQWVEFKRD